MLVFQVMSLIKVVKANKYIQRIAKSVVFCVIRWRSLSHKRSPLSATADVGVSFQNKI